MTCDEARERLVEPEAAAFGSEPGAAKHLETCAACRDASRSYAGIEALFSPEKTGTVPAEFDARVAARLSERSARRIPDLRKLPRSVLVGAGVFVAALLLVTFLVRKKTAPPPPAPVRGALPRPAAKKPATPQEAAPPSILAVGSAPLSVSSAPLPKGERERVAAMFDADFLGFVDALSALDAFYPEDAFVGPRTPGEPEPPAVRPAESNDERELRLLGWRGLTAAERERIEGADRAYRALPAERREEIERRWASVSWFPVEEKVGLRRIISRLSEADARSLGEIRGQIRAVAIEPVELRGPLWRELPFQRGLTGQEQTAGERLLLAR